MNKKLITCASLLATGSMRANGGFIPSWLILYRLHASMSFYVFVSICLIIEFALLCWLMPQENRIKIGIATMVMNLASTIVGFFYMSILDLGILAGFMLLIQYNILNNQSVVYWILMLAGYCLWFILQSAFINGLIEALVARLFLKTIPFKKLFLYIALVNAATALIALAFPFAYEYFYGPIVYEYFYGLL